MRHEGKPRSIWWLVAAVTSFSGFAWFVNSFVPIFWYQYALFFSFLFASSFFSLLYLLNNVRRSLLLSLGLVLFLLLRFLNLREPIYIILLAASLISLELLLTKR